MKKALISPLLFIIAFVVSTFYFGLTFNLIQVACIAVGFVVLWFVSTFITLKFTFVRIISIACLMFVLLFLSELYLFSYLRNALQDTMRTYYVIDFIQQNYTYFRSLLLLGIFILETFLILCHIRTSFLKIIFISVITYAITGGILFLSWRYGLSTQTKANLFINILDDLLKIYTDAQETTTYQFVDATREYIQQLSH